MSPSSGDKKLEKSYLSSAVDSLNPFSGSRSATSTPDNSKRPPSLPASTTASPADHRISALYGQSFRTYPSDCPPLAVQWYHAVDVPKRKPHLIGGRYSASNDAKPSPPPKKFTAFAPSDSWRIEARYQKFLEAAEDDHDVVSSDPSSRPRRPPVSPLSDPHRRESETGQFRCSGIKSHVPVNEDFLFDVDILERELAPAYWLGPVYEVRRGTWFFQEGSSLRPCEENLAAQLEEGYLKMRPWLPSSQTVLQPASRGAVPAPPKDTSASTDTTAPTLDSTPTKAASDTSSPSQLPSQPSQPPGHRLFGAYMNSVVTYQDENTAWLSTDSVLSWVTTSVYERFAGGGYMGGIKLTRGYVEPKKSKEKADKTKTPLAQGSAISEESQTPATDTKSSSTTAMKDSPGDEPSPRAENASDEGDNEQTRLQREISSLLEREGRTAAETEEQIRKREEREIQDDYSGQAGETQGRELEHLILVTHGIGQRLGLRMESVNFIHDVNVLRKTMKSVYSSSPDLKALNSDGEPGPGNCRVQVLPVCWRHLIDFPKRHLKKGEHDLGDLTDEEDEYPSLEDITVEGVAFARSLISDLALDVLLYQSSYREEIAKVVVGETNRIRRLFQERYPNFRGKVHLMGHSLGSAIYFDALCRQREGSEEGRNPLRMWPTSDRRGVKRTAKNELQFDFDVHDFFCLGSPIGLFQMLKGRTITGRLSTHALPSESPLDMDETEDPFLAVPLSHKASDKDGCTKMQSSKLSSPKIRQLFNIFHPSDPISYRLEPLISPAMATLKPQPLPYTKKGIFGAVGPQGLTGIGAKVGQSVSGLWSSLSSGIASNLLNRSLGLTNEEVARIAAARERLSPSPKIESLSDGHGDSDFGRRPGQERKRKLPEAATVGDEASTLIDGELETLYSAFEKKRGATSNAEEEATSKDEMSKARKLRAEEAKVRALNRNGRVDYSIQEGALDFNLINTIASHMGYWADEDVNHFILSQLLSDGLTGRRRTQRPDNKEETRREAGA